jgi:hypothetical protein
MGIMTHSESVQPLQSVKTDISAMPSIMSGLDPYWIVGYSDGLGYD